MWSNPFPKWVKSHRIIAEQWLIALFLFISLGLFITFSRGLDEIRFQNFPNIHRLQSQANEVALKENINAQLAMVAVNAYKSSDYPERYDEALKFTTWFYYCSTSDEDWSLQVKATENGWGVFKKTQISHVSSAPEFVQWHFLPNCKEHAINGELMNENLMIETLREYIPAQKNTSLETYPRVIVIKGNEDVGVYWTAIFKYRSADYAFGIVVDNIGFKLKTDEIEYPYNWRTDSYSEFP